MLGDSNGDDEIRGIGMTFTQYIGRLQINQLEIVYHPIYKYFIGNNDYFREDMDNRISNQIGLTKQQYQDVIIENFKGKVRSGNTYFSKYADAELAMGWVDSMRTMQKLRVAK
jgi:hypothetical protein